jgi:D-aminopeptidase
MNVRPRELGISFWGTPGPYNTITDVPGVLVGYETLIEGENVRTGVTAILPRGNTFEMPCYAAFDVLNGNGEMTGCHWIQDSGFLDSPILITNTHSVGIVRDAVIEWQTGAGRGPVLNRFGELYFSLPVIAETADFVLNDMNGFHVRPEHVINALSSARSGEIKEGNVGGGTGMICHGWKGGTGTASRTIGPFTLGVLVQANHGSSKRLSISGVPVGLHFAPPSRNSVIAEGTGSIIVVVATDAPLLPHQLKRIARRVALGVGKVGGLGEDSSGDIFLAFSTKDRSHAGIEDIDPYFAATVDATEEAIINTLFAAETMTGRNGVRVAALPKNEVLDFVLKRTR